MTWHVDEESALRYVARGLDAASTSSIESHLLACDRCRATVGGAVDDDLVSFVWSQVADALDGSQLGRVERTLRRLGCSDTTPRIVAATTGARFSYVIAVAISVAMAVVAGHSRGDQAFVAFLLLAPIGPVVATAGAFGRWADPAHAVVSVTPTSKLRIVLIRTAASVLPAIVLTALSVPVLLDRGWLAIAWLLPTLALALGALALSSWIDLEIASLIVCGLWLSMPFLIRVPGGELIDVFGEQIQIASIAIAAVGTLTMTLRRGNFEYWEA